MRILLGGSGFSFLARGTRSVRSGSAGGRRPWISLVLVGSLGLVVAGGDVSALTTTWVGGDGDWTDASQWDNGVPDATSEVLIDDGNPVASDVALDATTNIISLTLDAGDRLRILNGRRLRFEDTSGAITNDGLIQHEGTGFTWIRLQRSDLDIGGSGTIRLNGGSNQINGFGAEAPVLTHGAGHTIEGAGSIGSGIDMVNQGLIHANVAGGALTVASTNEFSNTGVVRASNGAGINMFPSRNTGAGGTYEAIGAGSRIVFFSDNRVEGAVLNGTDGGVVVGANAFNLGLRIELHDVVNQGLFHAPNTDLFGSFRNSGEVQVLNAQTLAVESDFDLTGGGTINLLQGGRVAGSFPLNNVDNTLAGFGDVDVASSFGAASVIAPGTPSDPTGLFNFNAPVTLGGSVAIDLGGVRVDSQAPNVAEVNRGTLPGGTEFDQLNILLNPVTFGSDVAFDVAVVDGFLPAPGDFFDVLTAEAISVDSALNFDFPSLPGLGFTAKVLTLFDPIADRNRDVLRIIAVPEPGSLLLVAWAGLGAFAARAVRNGFYRG